MKTIKFFASAFLCLTLLASCSSDDDGNPAPVNEEEVITTLILTLSPQGGGTDIVFQSKDADGDGPLAPVVTPTTGSLVAGGIYDASVQVLNELEDPAEDITLEVAEEDDEHQFFFVFSGAAGSSYSYDDMDDDGNPIGIDGELTAGVVSTGNTLTVTLIHEPAKDAAGVSDGDITNAAGETDIEVTFTFDVN